MIKSWLMQLLFDNNLNTRGGWLRKQMKNWALSKPNQAMHKSASPFHWLRSLFPNNERHGHYNAVKLKTSASSNIKHTQKKKLSKCEYIKIHVNTSINNYLKMLIAHWIFWGSIHSKSTVQKMGKVGWLACPLPFFLSFSCEVKKAISKSWLHQSRLLGRDQGQS